jgi:plastocyanin
MFRRLLVGLAAVTALAACGSATGSNAVVNNTSGSEPAPGSSQTVVFKETEYSLSPDTLTLKPGTYTFKVQDVGQFPHDLHVAVSADGTEMGGSTVVTAGQTASFTVTLKPGLYTLWCAVDAHRSLGMQGKLTVQ